MKQLAKYNENNEQIIVKNPLNGKDTIIELCAEPIGQFIVRAGADSSYSYTGYMPYCGNLKLAKERFYMKYNAGEIFK